MQNPKHIVITGASSGIGACLAENYAAPGVTLGLIARRMDKLEALAAACRAKGATVWLAPCDATEREKMVQILISADDALPVDLLIANAGISGGTFGQGENEEQARAIFTTNLDGTLNTVQPILPRMLQRGRGQIALMASMASFRGLPSCPAYCASKAAIRIYGEGLRLDCAQHGVEVNVICPGFVRTPMTQVNGFPMPFLMDTEPACHIIKKGLAKNHARIAFPWPMGLAIWFMALLPSALTDVMLRHLPKKAALTN